MAGAASGSGTLNGNISGAAVTAGQAGGSGTMNGNIGGAAIAAGQAGGSAAANIDGVLGGTAIGITIVSGETHPYGGGTAAGVGTLSPADGAYLAGGSGTAAGVASGSGTGGILYLVTGVTGGVGTLTWDFIVEGGGTALGFATVTGSGQRIINAKGFVKGSTTMVWSFPLPMVGKAIMVAHAEVTRVLSLKAITAPPKCFRYLQLLQRGDCSIFISDYRGPVSPHEVRYTLFQQRPNGTRFQVGPARRVPVTGIVGEYYATGRAGEGGQPGVWIIRWEYRRFFQAPLEVKEQSFQVIDAVGAADPRDVTVRTGKYGWN